MHDGTAEIVRFKGKKAEHIKNYVKSHLSLDKPDTVIIQAGGNDLQSEGRSRPTPVENIADHLVETGETCRRYGAKRIFIGGVTSRKGLQRECFALNDEIKKKCARHGFTFIDNSNISVTHLTDGVHLSDCGSEILKRNFLDALNDTSV